MACVSAAGSSIPPMVVFKRGNLTEDLIQGEVPDILYGLSKKWLAGWKGSFYEMASLSFFNTCSTCKAHFNFIGWTLLTL